MMFRNREKELKDVVPGYLETLLQSFVLMNQCNKFLICVELYHDKTMHQGSVYLKSYQRKPER